MRIDVLTLFPEVMQPYLGASILGRAQAAGIAEFHTHQLRDYSKDPHKKVDDRPFGGGPGMVLSCQPVVDAVAAIEAMDSRPALRVLMTPQGRRFEQRAARRFAECSRLLLICGHYEGFDERIVEILQPEEISIGDFVMTGGEIAALAIIDSVIRLRPGALGCEASPLDESFSQSELEYPQYTRPQEFRGRRVPEILLSGHHGEVEKWRRQQAAERTRSRRPDLGDGGGKLENGSEAAPAGVGAGQHHFASATVRMQSRRGASAARRYETQTESVELQVGAGASALRC